MSINSSRFLGTATIWGLLETGLIQFPEVVVLGITFYFRIRETATPLAV
jgi:hypothetical protein